MRERFSEEGKIYPSLDQLIVPYTGKETELEPPQEAQDILKLWKEKGITNFDVYRLSEHTFDQNGNYPGWEIKPKAWFWVQIQRGSVSSNAASLEDMWVAVDRTQKPNYDIDIVRHQYQQYPNDPFADLLKNLRQEGKIKVPRPYRHVPPTSRFAISPDELTQHVLPEIAKLLEVKTNQVRLPKEIEFNVIGNVSHPEWGQTNTYEWFEDNYQADGRLYGGCSGFGGFAIVDYAWSSSRDDGCGFRPLVVLSPKA